MLLLTQNRFRQTELVLAGGTEFPYQSETNTRSCVHILELLLLVLELLLLVLEPLLDLVSVLFVLKTPSGLSSPCWGMGPG
jgi:hypothetical protein